MLFVFVLFFMGLGLLYNVCIFFVCLLVWEEKSEKLCVDVSILMCKERIVLCECRKLGGVVWETQILVNRARSGIKQDICVFL